MTKQQKTIQMKKGATVSRTHIKKLLKDESTVIVCRMRLTDDYHYDRVMNFGKDETISNEYFGNVLYDCITHIKQPKYTNNYIKGIEVVCGVDSYYTLYNEKVEWI